VRFLAKRPVALAAAVATTAIAAAALPAASGAASAGSDFAAYEAICPPSYGVLNPIIGCMPNSVHRASLAWQAANPQEAGFPGPAPTS
jgi:hypothetical protein